MTAQQARQLTDKANSQSGGLAIIYKKIEKKSLKGESWFDINYIVDENINILKDQGYDVINRGDKYLIEW